MANTKADGEIHPDCAARIMTFLDAIAVHVTDLQKPQPSLESYFDRFDPEKIQKALERDSAVISSETTKLALTMQPPFELDLLNFILGHIEAASERLVVTIQSIPQSRGKLLSKEVRYTASSALVHVASLANSYLATPRNLDDVTRLTGNPFFNTGAVWQSADLFKGLIYTNRAWVTAKMKVLQGLLDDALEETEDSLINEGDSGTEGDDSDGEGGNGNEDLFDHKLTARERAVIQLVVSLVKLVKMTFKKLVIRTFVDVLDDTEDNVQWYDAIWEKATSVSSKVDDLAGTAQSPPFSNDEIATESSALISECEQLCSLAESKTEGVHAVWWQNAKQQLRKAQSSFSNVPSLENGTPHGKEHSEVCMYLK